MRRRHFGNTRKGIPVHRFCLESAAGVRVSLMEYGASVVSIETPDRFGNLAPVTSGHDSLEHYLEHRPTLGATFGGFTDRATDGLSRSVWWGEALGGGVRFHYRSPAGEDGRPCALECAVEYRLDALGVLRIDAHATSDARAAVDLATNIRFNLAGGGSNALARHELEIASSELAQCDREGAVTGHLERVDGETSDFRRARPIGTQPGGDAPGRARFYLADTLGPSPRKLARLHDPESGRYVEVFSSQPALRFEAITHESQRARDVALCPQNLPGADRYAHFPDPWATPQRSYHHATLYRFGIER